MFLIQKQKFISYHVNVNKKIVQKKKKNKEREKAIF